MRRIGAGRQQSVETDELDPGSCGRVVVRLPWISTGGAIAIGVVALICLVPFEEIGTSVGQKPARVLLQNKSREGVVTADELAAVNPVSSTGQPLDPSGVDAATTEHAPGSVSRHGNAEPSARAKLQPRAIGIMIGLQNPMPGAPNPLGTGTLASGGAVAPEPVTDKIAHELPTLHSVL
jgi:hypothetical protein